VGATQRAKNRGPKQASKIKIHNLNTSHHSSTQSSPEPPLPKVSLCTATYNRSAFLPLLQQHILAQTYPRELLEWIILDDSDDGSQLFQPDPHQGLTIRYQHLPAKVTLGKKLR
jgi:cellulose synthase/poly-beta-1,6-N-acetylglucosamine synthase-like glycosyltransferase